MYDALLLMSFGGPESPDDVMPFLRNVVRGRNVPDDRLLQVAEHYHHFGGISPINEQNRRLISALQLEFRDLGLDMPIYFGNRNWHPMIEDTVQQMVQDGIKRALALATSAYSSYSSCRQYLEDIARAQSSAPMQTLQIDKIPPFWNTAGFIAANAERLREALSAFDRNEQVASKFVCFTAHSIPTAMGSKCDYQQQLQYVADEIAQAVGISRYSLAFQSRSGPPSQPWLEPDICDLTKALHDTGLTKLVIHPIGFLSDHMEVLYDLDVEAQELCSALGIEMVRAGTVGTHRLFVRSIAEMIAEYQTGKRALEQCAPNCCPSGRPVTV